MVEKRPHVGVFKGFSYILSLLGKKSNQWPERWIKEKVDKRKKKKNSTFITFLPFTCTVDPVKSFEKFHQ